ncbi:MAG TPA: hypothetical protein VFQ42_03980 [Mycobacterium sp.]|nr:hypothetical protein [Mycobacterium sp.]
MQRVVHTSKSPFELWLLAATLLSGLAGVIAPGNGSRVVQALPHWAQILWSVGIATAAAMALTGALTSRLWSLYVERGALSMLGLILAGYTAAIIAVAGPSTATGSALVLGLAVACGARVRQLNVDIRRVLRGEGA